MNIDDIRRRLVGLGAGPAHVRRVLRLWATAQPQDSGRRKPEDFLPLSVRNGLPALIGDLDRLVRIEARFCGEDGASRLLLALADGQQVESVLLPRDAVCVSTQVGCAVGCRFCMTGRSGLLRQLGSAEIVAQVVLARALQRIRKVVFMGMGEPAHNLDNVMDAVELLGGAGGIGHKNLVVSTVGDRRLFDRLLALHRGDVRPALALSLHTTDAALRRELLPLAPAIAIDEMVELADRYARSSGYPTQVQWTLLEGINDGAAEIDGIVRLLAGRHAILNLIPVNAIEAMPYRRPPWSACEAMARRLRQAGILTTLRDSAAQSVDGGCGQLRARLAAPASRHPTTIPVYPTVHGALHA